MNEAISTAERVKAAQRVTWVGFFVNLVLTLAKVVAGVVGHSAAMLADGVHSLSDFATDVVVLAFVKISGKEKDENHPYGHGKYETFATLIIAMALFGVGVGILVSGVENIVKALHGESLDQPGVIALWAALVSIVSKELLYRYTIVVGRKINNQAVIANGWHHRSDAFSSIGTALGISGAIFLGEQWRILDPLAGVIVSFFILKVSVELALPSMKELLESSLPKEEEKKIKGIIMSHPDVKAYHHLRTRKIGAVCAIDVHIKLDRNISFVRSHDIATELERQFRRTYGANTELNIHTEPI